MTASPEKLRLFRSIDDRLAARGRHRRPAWWDTEAAHQYLHPTARRHLVEAGRGSDKSTMGLRFAETEMLSDWEIPGNEIHYYAWVSENVDEAAQRPRQVENDFRDLGIPCVRTGNTVELIGRPIGFKSFAARVGAVSGFRCIGFQIDEAAKGEGEFGAEPIREVIASMRAMTVTHTGARGREFSAPWTKDTHHARQCDLGDTVTQTVARGIPSWVANPEAITEERTRELEPDHATWLREYAAVAADAISTNWFGSALDVAIEDRTGPEPWCLGPHVFVPSHEGARYVIAVDQSFQHDLFAWAVATHVVGSWNDETRSRGPSIVRLQEVGGWVPDRSPRDLLIRLRDEVLRRFRTWRTDANCAPIFCDQFAGSAFVQLARDVGIHATVIPWTGGATDERADPEYRREFGDPPPSASKSTRFRAVRLAMSDGRCKWLNDPALMREARSVRGVLTPSGNERIEVVRSVAGHGDRLHAAVMACSIALDQRPDLPPALETWMEARERRRRERSQEANGWRGWF